MFQRSIAIALCLILFAVPALGENDHVLTLPSAMVEVQEEAFMGLSDIQYIFLPEGLERIGDYAFADIESLRQITIPASVTDIGSGIVDGAKGAVLIGCEPDSEAMAYAQNNYLDYNAGTRYRLLAIGETYPGTEHSLNGPDNDIDGMKKALENLSGMSYEVVTALNPTASEIQSLIKSTFSTDIVQDQDVSVLYYSGHGSLKGELIGSDLKYFSPTQLKQTLSAIPGRKIVIVDACYSGKILDGIEVSAKSLTASRSLSIQAKSTESAVQDDAEGEDVAEAFNSAFLSAFTPETSYFRKSLQPNEFFILTACSRDQLSYSVGVSVAGSETKRFFGIFTVNLCEAIGWNQRLDKANATMKGDTDGDDAVSITEAYVYAKEGVNRWLTDYIKDTSKVQDVQVYPEVCSWFAPFRG